MPFAPYPWQELQPETIQRPPARGQAGGCSGVLLVGRPEAGAGHDEEHEDARHQAGPRGGQKRAPAAAHRACSRTAARSSSRRTQRHAHRSAAAPSTNEPASMIAPARRWSPRPVVTVPG